MTKVIEYRDIKDSDRQIITRLADGYSSKVRNNVVLLHCGPGWEPAGSMARLVETPYYAVRYMIQGAVHGQRYLTETEARAHFNRLTQS